MTVNAPYSSHATVVDRPKTMPIAIIGMSCRFPGNATTPNKLWELCAQRRSTWSEIPKDRFNARAWYHPDKEHIGTSYVQGAHFLSEDISHFDASFFQLSAEAAASMDPEVRLQLESVYEAFESAGLAVEDFSGSNTAVYAGTCFRDFHDSHMRDPSSLERTFLTGNGMAMISNRVSHFYNLKGASIAVDTGCSTTLTLLHQACQSLRTGEAGMAVVGGSNLLINPDMFIWGSIGGLLSAEGKCFAFDSRASGYGRGEGVAALILKPLDAAIRDNDPVRAVIRGTAVNQDGKTSTLTTPSRQAQQDLMRECYSMAGLDPRDTGYVEAHGTGTQVGDSTEAAALGTALGSGRGLEEPLIIGSVKTNIGHTEAVSGLAAVIHAVLAIENECISPSLNFETPNPSISFDQLRLKVSQALQPWPTSSLLRASVNNFGYGGTNGHAIIEHPKYLTPYYHQKNHHHPTACPGPVTTAPCGTKQPPSLAPKVLIFSAKDERGVLAQFQNLQEYARKHVQHEGREDDTLERLAYTLGQKRSRFAWSTAVPVASLKDFVDAQPSKAQRSSHRPRLGFVFSGQGAQWYGMGRELLETYPVFRHAIEEATQHLCAFGAPWSLLDELNRDEHSTRINQVAISLPASVAIQLALLRLLQSWGIEPTGVTGHSSGEVAAAFAVGALDMRTALAVVYSRGSLTTEFQKVVDRRGGMMAVGLSRDEVRPYLDDVTSGQLDIACINSQSSVTISGDLPAIMDLERTLSEQKIFARRLKVDAAYHSHHMLGIADAYRKELETLLKPPSAFKREIIYSSPVTGQRLECGATIASADHWVKNMLQPVEFLDSLANMCVDPDTETQLIDSILEIGPHAALKGPIRQILSRPQLVGKPIAYQSCLTRGENAVETMQSMACTLLSSGYPVSLASVNFPRSSSQLRVLTDLPPYPWNHEASHWQESRANKLHRQRKFPVHELLGVATECSNPFSRRWKHVIRSSDIPWVQDHRFQTNVVYPGAGYVCMAIEAIRQTQEDPLSIAEYQVRRIDIRNALVLPETRSGVEVHFSLEPSSTGALEADWQQFKVMSVDASERWTVHCEGEIRVILKSLGAEANSDWIERPKQQNNEARTDSVSLPMRPRDLYDALAKSGLQYGPTFSNITSIQRGSLTSTCDVKIPDCEATMPARFQQEHVLHPATLDAVFQAVFTALPRERIRSGETMLPRSIQLLSLASDGCRASGTSLEVFCSANKITSQGFESSATVNGTPGGATERPVLQLSGLFCQSLGSARQTKELDSSNLCFKVNWMESLALTSNANLCTMLNDACSQNLHLEGVVDWLVDKTLAVTPSAAILQVEPQCSDECVLDLDTIAKQSTRPLATFSKQNLETASRQPAQYDLIVMSATAATRNIVAALRERVQQSGLLLLYQNSAALQEADDDDALSSYFQVLVKTELSGREVILASPIVETEPQSTRNILLMHAGVQPAEQWLDQFLATFRHLTTGKVKAMELSEVGDTRGFDIIFMDDPENSVLAQSNEAAFNTVKCNLLHATNFLWISQGGTMNCENPTAALHLGLLRSLRCEQPSTKFVSLDIDHCRSDLTISHIQTMARIFRHNFTVEGVALDQEYALRRGSLYVPRVAEDVEENVLISNSVDHTRSVDFHQTDRKLRLGVRTPGLLDTLAFVEDDSVRGPLPTDFVQIKPAAFGLNFRDVMVAMGQLDETRMGFECSGYIEAVGPEAAARGFRIGDAVYAFLRGYFANTIRVHHTSVAKVPQDLDMATAASIPLVFITAYHALHNMAGLQKNERILIHSGTGGVGQAAIMLAQLTDAEVFVTVGSREKKDFLMSTYNLPQDHIFYSRNGEFAEDVLRSTGGKGVDVVLNSLAGALLAATWKCIVPFGRFIEIGKRDLELNSRLEMAPFTRSVTFASLDLITLGEMRGEVVAKIFVDINCLLQRGCIRPVSPVTQFPISHAEKAFRTMQAGRHMGKIVIVPHEGVHVEAVPQSMPVRLSASHSYLIVGGLGGIGRSIAQWMIERGARSLILLSRSASNPNEETKQWVHNLRNAGIRLFLEACDVADESQLAPALMRLMLQGPAIRGVVQAAMVLNDELFETMSMSSYEAAVRPKLQGSMNLDKLLPADLDFFVMLSSISGIGGNATQGNYAAGSTYQDALAQHRATNGKAAVSLDLGMVKGVGVLAGEDGKKTAARLERIGLRALVEDQVLQLTEAAIRRGRCPPSRATIVTGIPGSWARPGSFCDADIANAPFWMRDGRFSLLQTTAATEDTSASTSRASLADTLADPATSDQEAGQMMLSSMRAKLGVMFGVPGEEIDTGVSVAQLGIDSLLAVELRNWIIAAAKVECSMFDILQSPSLLSLAEKLVGGRRRR